MSIQVNSCPPLILCKLTNNWPILASPHFQWGHCSSCFLFEAFFVCHFLTQLCIYFNSKMIMGLIWEWLCSGSSIPSPLIMANGFNNKLPSLGQLLHKYSWSFTKMTLHNFLQIGLFWAHILFNSMQRRSK